MNLWRDKLQRKTAKGFAVLTTCLMCLTLGISVQAAEVKREPVLNGVVETTIFVGEEFDQKALMNRVLADDLEDGDISYKIEEIYNDVNTMKVGEYTIGYEVMDSDGNVSAINTIVKVVEKDDDTEKTIKRRLYTQGDASHLTDIGFNRGYYHDRQGLGIWIPNGGELQIRLVNAEEFNQNLEVTFMNQDTAKQENKTIPNSGEWVTIGNTKDTTWEVDGETIDRGSVPFIRTPKSTKANPITVEPIVEFKWTDDMKRVPYYRYKDDQEAFFAEWDETKVPYAIIEGSASTFLVPIKDRYDIVRTNGFEGFYPFASIDEMLDWYAGFSDFYDEYVGLDYYATEPYNQNIRSKFFIYANEHGAGAAYYGWDHSAQNGNTIEAYLHRSWLALHEFAHGFEGNFAKQEYSFVETTNNILAYHFQQTFLREGEYGWLLGNGGTREEKWAKLELDVLGARNTFHTFNEMVLEPNKKYSYALYMFVNLFEKIGGKEATAAMHTRFRQIYAETGKNASSGDVILESLSDLSKLNLVPYFDTFHINANSELANDIYDKDYAIAYYLKDILPDDEDAKKVMEHYGLSGVYSLVTTDELAYTGYTSNITMHLNVDDIEQIANKILLIKNGSKVVKTILIEDDDNDAKNGANISLELPVGVYEVELPAPIDKEYLYNREFIIAKKGDAPIELVYDHETGNPLADDMELRIVGFSWEFAKVSVDTSAKKLIWQTEVGSPHSLFPGQVYFTIQILDPNGQVLYSQSMIGDEKLSRQRLEFPCEVGTKMVIYHIENKLSFYSKYTKEKLNDYTAKTTSGNAVTVVYEMTEKGWKLAGEEENNTWDDAKHSQVYMNTLSAYSENVLGRMSAADLQDETSFYNEKILLELASKYLSEEEKAEYDEKYGILFGNIPEIQGVYQKISSDRLTGQPDTDHSEGRGDKAVDGNTSTYWHSNYSPNTTNMEDGKEQDNGYTILLDEPFDIARLEYLPRSGSINGRILQYKLYYSTTESGDDFQPIELNEEDCNASGYGVWANNETLKSVEFETVHDVRRIRIEAKATEGSSQNKFVTAAEFYLYEKYEAQTNARDMYLSDLLRAYDAEETFIPKKDKDATGNTINLMLNAENKTFDKGIGLLSNTVLTYDLTDRPFDAFSAYIGLEQGQTLQDTAKVSIYGDEKLLYETGELCTFASAEKVTVDLKGFKKLKIVVWDATENTQVSLADTKLYREADREKMTLQVGEVSRIQENMSLYAEADRWDTWTSENEAIATVDAKGNITAIAAGTTTITATFRDNTLTAEVTVVEPEVMKVSVDTQEYFMRIGETEALAVELYPEFAMNLELDWESADSDIVSVDENGNITAVAEGTTTVTATTVNGLTATFTRTVVDGEVTNPEKPADHTHTYSAWSVTKAETCLEDGYKKRNCECGEEEIALIKAIGHVMGDWEVTKEPTCAVAGVESRSCANCDYEEIKVIDELLPHTYSEWITIKDATCAIVGERRRTCSGCGEVQSKEIPKRIVHDYSDWTITKETSCAAAGEESRTCSVCEKTETREIARLTNHIFGDWVITKEATSGAKGEITKSCTVEGCTYKETKQFVAKAERPADGITVGQPFAAGTAGSNMFRIPCIVTLEDGTIVAACDARWTTYMDGGGLDTIVSGSRDNGVTWQYTLANYLGDNGNVHNKASTAFIDPAIATDGETVYMVADLFPAGYALNGANNSPVAGQNGLDANGNLRLSADGRKTYGYYLEKIEDGTTAAYYEIKNTKGKVVQGYIVDAYFNIKGDGVDTNLFMDDSPYKVYPTDYLYLTSSKDGGATWSIPSLINVKKEAEQTLLVGPGTGIVTSEGRIVFTVYEYTGGDKNSAVIYSDDKGVTWTRGASVSSQSSEATVVEADGKLYMFTRHGGYYVSEDWGATWSDRKEVGISYATDTMIHAITYSEKIDSKTAIILSAPAGSSRRTDGKLFVGLVQADGSLSWEYEYQINKGKFAYSSITELADGSIGILYENDDASILYKRVPITDIVGIWFEDEDGNRIESLNMKAGESVTFELHGTPENELEITSSDEAVTATWNKENGTVTISANAQVTGVAKATVTITDGSGSSIVLSVAVTGAEVEDYEVVDLYVGDTIEFRDETGNYDSTDVTGVADIAQITLFGDEKETTAQLATSAGNFNGSKVDMSDCLYTFDNVSKSDGGKTFTCIPTATTADKDTVYLAFNGGTAQIPNMNSNVNITATFVEDDGTFTFKSGGNWLYFYFDNANKLHFDRLSETRAGYTYFKLYRKTAEAQANLPIPGYAQVTTLDEIIEDGKYLIVKEGIVNDQSIGHYVLYPYSGGSSFNHVAKATGEAAEGSYTDISIKAVAAGSTSIKIGNVTYYITVKEKVEKKTVGQFERFFMKANTTPQLQGEAIVTMEENMVYKAPYTAVTDLAEITEGKYLFGSSSQVISNEEITDSSPKGLRLKDVDFTDDGLVQYLWILTASDNGYKIQDVNQKYIYLDGQSVILNDTGEKILFGIRENGTFSIGDGSNYFNKWGGSSSTKIAAYGDINDGNSKWYVYKPTTGYWFTAEEAGTTSVVIDGMTYEIEVTGCQHSDVELQGAVEATCSQAGYTGDIMCRTCDATVIQGSVIPVKEHMYGAWEVTKEPTCITEGTKTRACTAEGCDAEETKAMDAIGEAGHNMEWKVTTKPTCITLGESTEVCTLCQATGRKKTIGVTEHIWDSGVVTKEPTATEKGMLTYTCTVCSATKTEVIPALREQAYQVYCSTITEANKVLEGDVKYTTATLENLKMVLAEVEELGLTEESSTEALTEATDTLTKAVKALERASIYIATVANPTGAGALIGGGYYKTGDKVVISATTVGGYYFTGWKNGEETITTDTTFTYTVEATDVEKITEVTFTANYGTNTEKDLTVTFENGSVSYKHEDVTGVVTSATAISFSKGTNLTLTAAPAEGYEFLYWVNTDSRKVVCEEATYHFYFAENMNVQPYFKVKATENQTTFTVVFKDMFGKHLATQTVKQGEAAVAPEYSTYIGYTFTGWDKEFANVTADMEVTALYEAAGGYTITVTNGIVVNEKQTYTYGDYVTVKASVEGEFTGWYKEDVLVSTNETYSFYITGDVILEARAGETVKEEALVTMTMSEREEKENGGQRLQMVVNWSVPEGYSVLEAGIIRSSALENGDINLDTTSVANFKKVPSKLTTAKGTYAVTFNFGASVTNLTLYAKGYVTYQNDATGEVKTVVSGLCKSEPTVEQ